MKTLLPLALLVLAAGTPDRLAAQTDPGAALGRIDPAAASPDAGPRTRREADAQGSEDGLQRVEMRGMDLVYVRPGASLAPYRRVLLRPVTVSFQRNWARTVSQSTGSRVFASDIQHVREDMATVVRAEVARELGRGGYTLVDQPGEDVLELDVRVTELFLNAPDLPGATQTRSYSMSFGEMNLVAELRDSVTGAVVMRILDRALGREYPEFRFTTRVENTRDVGNAAQDWARLLRRQLELARAAGQGSNGRP